MLDGFVSPGALIEDLLANAAHETARAILSQHYPYHLDEATDAGIRERFPILLSPDSMKPGNSWSAMDHQNYNLLSCRKYCFL